MDGWIDGYMDGCMDACTGAWVYEWRDAWMVRARMHGWILWEERLLFNTYFVVLWQRLWVLRATTAAPVNISMHIYNAPPQAASSLFLPKIFLQSCRNSLNLIVGQPQSA